MSSRRAAGGGEFELVELGGLFGVPLSCVISVVWYFCSAVTYKENH